MEDPIAFLYWCEGAGHATRMLGPAMRLRDRGHDVVMGGGGPGTKLVEMNGFDAFDPPRIDLSAPKRSTGYRATAANILRNTPNRYRAIKRWLQEEEPAVLVTDDMYAMIAAARLGVDFYAINHLHSRFLEPLPERTGMRLYQWLGRRYGEGIFYTTLWPDAARDRDGYLPVNPVSHVDGDAAVDEDPIDVLVVPGTYSTGFDRIADRLAGHDRAVTLVGGPDWEPRPTMTQAMKSADVVLCTGFSSIADAAVSGTPVVVYPFICAQRAFAAGIEHHDPGGVAVARSVAEAVDHLQDPPAAAQYPNGAAELADRLEQHVEA